ncbi:DUF6668 family protein [Pseudokineococcus sp. 5B2Z-1]|uniref:DUF6668 family protein n=1 Tax=Pseudokineococcus sp. 5B2Z-1 TaxID=3132744 RepID=UPI003098160C
MGRNPWLTATQEPDSTEDEVEADLVGPASPQHGVDELESVDRLARKTPEVAASVWWLGAHGGAGESTLTEYLAGSRAADHCWPTSADEATPSAVVLVCRSHARGLHAAQRALTDWASGAVPGVRLLGLVVVADAPGKTPKPLRDLSRLVAGGAPRSWHLPWLEAARFAPADGTTAPPAAVRTLLRAVSRLSTPTTTTDAGATAPDTREVS